MVRGRGSGARANGGRAREAWARVLANRTRVTRTGAGLGLGLGLGSGDGISGVARGLHSGRSRGTRVFNGELRGSGAVRVRDRSQVRVEFGS